MSSIDQPKIGILRTVAMVLLVCGSSACTSYTDDGRLVRHQLGYTRIITPQSWSNEAPIRVLEVSNFGIWLKTDSRKSVVSEGSGFGLGARYTRREAIPLDCSLVIRLKADDDFGEKVEFINKILGGMHPCIIQDSEIPLSQRQ